MANWPAATGRRSEMERYLISLAGAHVFLHVLRGFNNPMLGEAPDPARDLAALDQEFLVGDLIAIERAFERAKKAKLSDLGRHALERAKEALEAETPVRLIDFPDDELALHRPYNLLTRYRSAAVTWSRAPGEEAAGAAESSAPPRRFDGLGLSPSPTRRRWPRCPEAGELPPPGPAGAGCRPRHRRLLRATRPHKLPHGRRG